MQANPKYKNLDNSFWSYIRFIGDKLGYSKRNKIINYKKEDVIDCLHNYDLDIDPTKLNLVMDYLSYRNDVLTNYIEPHLMDLDEAEQKFFKLKDQLTNSKHVFLSPQPMNKQKGDKKKLAFFTCAINLITENAINEFNDQHNSNITCDYDPHNLTFITDDKNTKYLKDTYSRRFDGAIPSLNSPVSIWEIKEYYYTTTFGSRIADGVYETQLDGYEVKNTTGFKPIHNFLIDGYSTWWLKGKSYLCRIVDTLNMGLVNEVIFGNEIYSIWPQRVKEFCEKQYQRSNN